MFGKKIGSKDIPQWHITYLSTMVVQYFVVVIDHFFYIYNFPYLKLEFGFNSHHNVYQLKAYMRFFRFYLLCIYDLPSFSPFKSEEFIYFYLISFMDEFLWTIEISCKLFEWKDGKYPL